MIAGTRKKVIGGTSYHNDPLYPFAKAFTEAANNILATETYDIFAEPQRAIGKAAVKESLREFFCNNFIDEANCTKSAEETEEDLNDINEMFENDIEGIMENTHMTDYTPIVGMSLPVHKLIMMNNVFAQGGGIQKVTAVRPNFSIDIERRILVTPDGKEIDMALQQNEIGPAIEATAPVVEYEVDVPENGDTDFIGKLGGTSMDKLSVETHISGIYVENVYVAEGDHLPDANGWFTTKGEVATAATAGLKNVWFHVNIGFVPTYGSFQNKLERIISRPVTIRYKKDAAGTIETITDTIFGAMDNNKITITSVKGAISKVRLAAKLDTSNALLDECSVTWRHDTEYVEIPEATPINTTVSPEEVKDVAALHDVNQVTKIMSLTKTAMSENKDRKIKDQLDASYERLDERASFAGEFNFARPEGYAGDWVSHRQATFFDYFDDYATEMFQVLNDPNMTVTIYGDPRIIRKITPSEYTYQSPANIGPVTLDYTQTVVNTKDHRVYNFVGTDKMRNTNELMVILNPRNSERICYRIYDYQLYISNEIRNANNHALPAIHAFERWKMVEMFPVQGRISILNPSGMTPTTKFV